MTKFAALAVALLLVAQLSGAEQTYSVPDNVAPAQAPDQPLPFSHRTHLATGVACANCHSNPDPGSMMTYPATETCLTCHQYVAADKEAIVKLQAFAEADEEIPWARVYAITPGVTWSHRAHLDAAVQCETCHGDMSQTEVVTEAKAVTAMATCIDCHTANAAPTACITCHAWPDDQLLGIDVAASSSPGDP